MYDLLIKGGRVIDPAQDVDAKKDIAITGGKIAKVAGNIPTSESKQTLDASGRLVTPGLIDIHCHIYDSIFKRGIEPDAAGVRQGVTTVVDGGSAGQAIFGGFRKFVIPESRSTVFCFINISSIGLAIAPELRDWQDIDVPATEAVIEPNLDIIKGVKIRLVGDMVAKEGVELFKTAQKTAKKFSLPVMIHIGDAGNKAASALTRKVLPLMQAGDIMSHTFTAQSGGILETDGKVMPELRDASERGVVLDIAHGKRHLSYDVFKKCMSQGILPTTVSTDMNCITLVEMVFGLTVTMSKLLALGVELKKVIETATINPARALHEDARIGSLKPGMNADISILEMLPGTWKLEDAQQQILETDRLISPVMTIKSGQVIKNKIML